MTLWLFLLFCSNFTSNKASITLRWCKAFVTLNHNRLTVRVNQKTCVEIIDLRRCLYSQVDQKFEPKVDHKLQLVICFNNVVVLRRLSSVKLTLYVLQALDFNKVFSFFSFAFYSHLYELLKPLSFFFI